MKTMLRQAAMMLLTITGAFSAKAQLTGTKTIPGTYTTIAAAISDLNTNGVGTGGVTFNISAGYAETISATLSVTATGTASNPIVFQRTGTGANPLVTAYTGGTGTPSSTTMDGIWNLVGSDYVTINGIDLQENSANVTAGNPATMEYGYALFKASATNGCQNDVIKNCVVTLSRINNAAGTAPMVDGSTGILVLNATPAAATTALTVTAASGANSRNQFYSNTVQNCNTGIALIGYAASSYSLADTLNDVGGASAATGNSILNFGGGGSANAAAGIRTLAQYALNVSYNTINNNNGNGVSHTTTLRGIYINTATSAAETINNNTITVISGAASSNLEAIENAGGSGTGGSVTISGNTISNCAYNTATGGSFYGIYNNGAGPDVLAINNNTLSGLSINPSSSTTTTVYFIYNGSTIGTTFNINGNTFQNATGLNTSGAIYAIYNNTSTSSYSVLNNTITNISRVITLGGAFYGHYNNGGGSGTANLNYNKISNITNGTGAFYGLHSTTGSSQNVNYTGNNINNITAGSGTIYGLYNTYGNIVNMNSDTLNTFTGAGSIYGVYGGSSSTITCNSFQNVVNTLYSTGGTVYGIYLNANYGSSSVDNSYKNRVYDLQSSYSSGNTYGIYASGSYVHNIYNNIIGDLKATTSTSTNAIAGIYISAGSTVNIYYNTVRLAAASSGTPFGTSALYVGSTSPTVTSRNNIFVNVSTPGSGGVTAAFRYTSTPGTSAYTNTSNNNLYYAGTASSTNLLYVEGASTTTNGQQTLSGLKTYLSTRDQSSISESPNFLSTTGSSTSFLHISSTIATAIESGGSNISGISDDFDGDIRAGNTGYSGTGTSPDIGADEFNGTSPAPKINSVSISPGAQCIAASHAVSASVTAGVNALTAVTLYYSVNGGSATSVAMTGGTSTGGTSTWSGTIPAATPANAAITYYVTATDGTYTSTGSTGTYQDAPFTGFTATASASPATICSGSNDTLRAVLTSSAAAPTTYTTPPAVGNPTTDEDLGNITLGTLNNTTPINSLVGTIGTAAGTAGSYSDFTSFGSQATLVAGRSYPISLSVLQQTTAYSNGSAVYIDYNRNGVFETTELAYVSSSLGSGGHTETGTITIPATASLGNTRLRVLVTESSIPSSPTQSISWGEYEEYIVNIAGAPATNTYTWVNSSSTSVGSGSTLVINPTATNSYSYTVSNAGGCTLTSPSVTVTTLPLPTAPTGTNSTQCGVGIPAASVSGATAGQTYKWYSATTGGTLLQNGGSTYTTSISTTTTFYVAISNGTCESIRTPVTVTVNTPDAITASATTSPACAGSTLGLSVTKATGSNTYAYTWTASPAAGSGITTSVSGATPTITPTVAGPYIYTVTGVDASAGCTAVSTVTVTVNLPPPAPLVTPSTPKSFCVGGSQALTALPGTYTIFRDTFETFPLTQWTTTGSGVTAAQNTTYYKQGSSSVGLTYGTSADGQLAMTNSVNLSQYSSPVLNFYQICATEGGFDYGYIQYSTDNGTTWTSFPTSSYSGSGTLKNSVVSFDKSSYSDWGSQFTSASSTPGTGPAASLWKLETINLSGYQTATQFKVRFRLTSDGSINYYGWLIDSVAITSTPAVTYAWASTPAGFTASTQNTTVTPSAAGTYTYKATATATVNGCTSSATTANVVVNPLPTISVSPATAAVCIGSGIALTASGATTYAWTGTGLSASAGTTVTATPTATGTASYTITGTDANGCVNSTIKSVTVNALPTVSISPTTTTTFCAGGSVSLTASGATTYSWSPATGLSATSGATVTANPTTTQTYTVTGTNLNGCQNTATKTVNVNPLPIVSVSPSSATGICIGQAVSLTASGAVSYSWNNTGSLTPSTGIGATVSAAPTTTTTYTVTGTDSNGCVNTATKIVTVNPLPTITVSPTTTTTICSGTNVPLTAGGAVSYSWSPATSLSAATGATVNASPAATQTYTVTGTDANGCVNTANKTVNVITSPTVTISPSTAIIFCAGQSASLTAGGAVSYSWSPATGLSATSGATVTASPTATVTYTVTGTAANGCTGQAIKVVTVNPLPSVAITPSVTSVCIGLSVPLAASGATTYSWSPAATLSASTGATVTATPSANTTYTVTGTDGNGCINTATSTITVNSLPIVTISPSPSITICLGSSATLIANGASTYSWSPAGGLSSTNAPTVSASPSGTTTYTVIGTDANGCRGTASKTINVNPLPVVSISPATAVAICSGAGATLTASGATSYTWTPTTGLTPTTGATVNASPGATTTYTVTGTDGNGCQNTASRLVTVLGLPAITIFPTGTTTICEGNNITLTAIGAVSYSWTPAGTLSAPTGTSVMASPIATTTYTITGIAANGCQSTVTKTVNVNPKPRTAIAPVGYINTCGGDTVRLSGPGGYDSYQWLLYGSPVPGGADSLLATVTGGFYTLKVTDLSTGCVGVTPIPTVINVAARPDPVVTAAGATMSTGAGYTSYQWMMNGSPVAGATGRSYTAAHDGYYSVMVTDTGALHCSGISTVYHLTALGITTTAGSEVIRIYPNPTADVLHVDAPAGTSVSVLSMDGKLMFSGTDVHELSIGAWADGVYRVVVRDRAGTFLKGEKITKVAR